MATVKKPSKAMSYQNEKCNDLDKAKKAISEGAKIVTSWDYTFAIEYPTGGYFRITKRVYNKLIKK